MATTTNYAWETPDDTDLVKDGAAAIRTLGSSIDTTTKALNPSTTLGDIEYRSATANTNTRLALGTAGQVLQVNSGATAPEWATPASGSTFAGWLIYKTATQTISNNTWTSMTWESELYDSDAYHSTVTNTSRATIPSGKAGKYLLNTNIGWLNGTTGERYVTIYKNGAAVTGADSSYARNTLGANPQTQNVVTIMDLAEGDYVEVKVFQGSGGNLDTLADNCNFIGYLIGA